MHNSNYVTVLNSLTRIEEYARLRQSEGKVSSRYGHVSTIDLLQMLAPIVDLTSVKIQRQRGKGSFHHISVPVNAPMVSLAGDYCKPTVHIMNSYLGESTLTLRLGIYRLVCSNGLVVGKSLFELRYTHVKGKRLDQLVAELQAGLERSSEIFERVTALSQIRIDIVAAERILDDTGITSKKAYNAALKAFKEPVRASDTGDNAWLVYNRMQEALHSKLKGREQVQVNAELMDRFLELVAA